MKNGPTISYVKKRSGEVHPFEVEKITQAILKAMLSVNHGQPEDAQKVTDKVLRTLEEEKFMCGLDSFCPDVEHVQDLVEESLMSSEFHTVAKAYILYRKERADLRKRDLFKKRIALKPYEYPELYEYVSAIRHSYWIHTEFNFVSDVQDFKVNVTEVEKSAIKNAMLAIAQIEVAVKTFWGDIYKKMPKPEIGAVGATFAESEVRHTDAYSHLLEILGLNDEFRKIQNIPALVNRVNYLEKNILNRFSYSLCLLNTCLFSLSS